MLEAGLKLQKRYEILSHLGAGGMGEVYRARDTVLGRDVAIKVLPEDLAGSPQALQRFEREAKALATLSHPNILSIHDFGSDHSISYLVMELLDGDTLRGKIASADLSYSKTLQIAIAVAEGLWAAHSRGIIHRDLKPENIFLTSDGIVKILDFGLARMEEALAPDTQSLPTRSIPTAEGHVVGTVPYMSPEQVRGGPLDPRTDIFSFGCVLYEMLTGGRPFARDSAAETMAAILKDDPLPVNEMEQKLPAEAQHVILHCLEKNRDERFQSARDLAFALKALLSGSELPRITTKEPSVPARKRRTSRKAVDSLAVLPLVNAGGDPNMEYLSDGITESIINSVSQIPKLRVMARSTVFRYKGREMDPQQIGVDLNVRAVLTGRMVQRAETLNIQTELVDVLDGSQLWGEQYVRKMQDIFAIQEEISQEISSKLRLKLSGEEKNRLVKRHTANTEAYELYLRGRFCWNKRTSEGLKKAIEYFQLAAQKDPEYAQAYSGLADCYNLLSAYGFLAPKDSVPLARTASTRALTIDPMLAEAHETLAHVKMLYDWDWSGAEIEFKKAIELNPNYATAHQRYAIQLAAQGRMQLAEKEIRKAQELDPLSLIINTDVGLISYFQAQHNQAITQFRKTLDLDPDFSVAHFALGLALEQEGRFEEALAEFETGMRLSGDRSFLSSPAHTLAISGRPEEARSLLAELVVLSTKRYVSPYRLAIVYAGLREIDRAFEWLDKACEDRSVWLIHLHLARDPRFHSIRNDPRFTKVLQRISV